MRWTWTGIGRSMLFLAGSFAFFGCGDSPFEVIDEVEFASSLNVDLSLMTKTASGLYYRDLVVGTGTPAASGDVAEVDYSGALRNGSVFGAGAFTFTLGSGGSIAGFDEGVTGMQVGGRRQLIIPPELGYGDQPRSGIPAGSILVFDVQLISLQ